MSTLAAMAVVAVLFAAWGLLRARDGADCAGGSCATCSGSCHRRSSEEVVHEH